MISVESLFPEALKDLPFDQPVGKYQGFFLNIVNIIIVSIPKCTKLDIVAYLEITSMTIHTK